MGVILGKAMDENLKKNQEFMTEMNRITVERQIHMQNQMRERMAAMQVAKAREMFMWLGSFYGISALAMVAGYVRRPQYVLNLKQWLCICRFRKSRRPAVIAPLLPLTFVVGYQADMAYGNKLKRIRSEAESILVCEGDLLDMPCRLPSLASLDKGRLEEEKYRLNSVQAQESS